MNPDQPSREQIETRITALLLGELPAEEATLLRYTIAQDPALQKLHDQLQSALPLVREAAKHPAEAPAEKPVPLTLSTDRREKLFAHFKTPRPEVKREPLFWFKRIEMPRLVPVLAAVAVIALLAAMLLPVLSKAKNKAMRAQTLSLSGAYGPADESESSAKTSELKMDNLVVARALPPPQPSAPAVVTFKTEPQPAPPPAAPSVQIFLPQPESTPEVAAQSGAPATTGESQNVVGYVNVPPGDQGGQTVTVSPTTAADTVTAPSVTTESGRFAINNADGQRPRALKQGYAQVEDRLIVPSQTVGGVSGFGGGGGGIGGASAGNREERITPLLANNNWSDGGVQNPPEIPEGATNGILAWDDSGVNRSHPENQPSTTSPATAEITYQFQSGPPPAYAANPIGAFPGAVSGQTENSTLADHKYYRVRAHQSDEAKTESVDEPPALQTAAENASFASAPAPMATPPPAQLRAPVVAGGSFALDQSVDTIKPTFQSASAASSDADKNGFAFKLQNANPEEGPAQFRDTFGASQPQPNSQLTQSSPLQSRAQNMNESATVNPAHGLNIQGIIMGPATDSYDTTPSWTGLLTNAGPNPNSGPASENKNQFVTRYAYTTPIIQSTNFIVAYDVTNSATLNVDGSDNATFNPGVAAIQAAPQDMLRQPGASAEETISPGAVDFQGMDLNQVLDTYGKLVNRTVLRSSLPQAQIAIKNNSPLTKAQTIEALQSALALNGVSVVDIGDKFVKAVPSDQAGTTGGDIDRNGSTNVPALGPYVTQVVQLQHVKPTEMMPVIQPFARLTNSILPIDNNGILVLRDNPENVERMLKIIYQVDVSVPAEYVSEVIPIRYAKADDIASSINGLDNKLVGQTKIIANEVGNSLLVYATRTDMETIKGAVAKLDTETQSDLPIRKPAPDTPLPQPEILASSNAFSTFSMNVSDVSFKFAEASLQNGRLPDTASIRSEEFINAFDYRDPEAAPGQPMAFTSERAQYPFAHNRELLRFSLKTAAAGRQAGRPLNLVLLLDTSGSMERADRVDIIHEALRVLAAQLHENDIVSVVSFARTARLWADGVSGDKAGETLNKVGGITPEGGTNLEEAMRLAYETAHRHYLANGLNRVVLLTDGAANLGNVDPGALKQKVDAQRKQGIALDCFGIGWEDYNDDLLEELSSNGDGRYAFLNSPEDAAKDFGAKLAGALQVAAQDLKVQVEFNPQRVIAYRQIGYARHQLTKEQFRDNTVAAGEIAAQEAGNALYTIETNPDGDGPIATVHVRYRIPGTQNYREHSWDVEYTGHASALDQSSPAMRLAATASAFSEWLAASPYAQEVTPDELAKYLSGVPEVYGADDRPKQLETMIREARSLEGK